MGKAPDGGCPVHAAVPEPPALPSVPEHAGSLLQACARVHVWGDGSSWRMPQGHSDKGKGMRLLGMLNKEEGDDSAGPNEQEWT